MTQHEMATQAPGPLAYPGSTKWTNPTDRVVKLKLHKGPPAVKRSPYPGGAPIMLDTGYLEFAIAPNESILLPSIYDDAIQSIDAQGVIQWGLAPQLIKNDALHEMHPALDPLEQQRIEGERKAAEAVLEKQKADAAVLVASGKQAEAERMQAEAKVPARERHTKKD